MMYCKKLNNLLYDKKIIIMFIEKKIPSVKKLPKNPSINMYFTLIINECFLPISLKFLLNSRIIFKSKLE